MVRHVVELYTLEHCLGDIAVHCKCVVVELTDVGGALAGAWQWCVSVREREREVCVCVCERGRERENECV